MHDPFMRLMSQYDRNRVQYTSTSTLGTKHEVVSVTSSRTAVVNARYSSSSPGAPETPTTPKDKRGRARPCSLPVSVACFAVSRTTYRGRKQTHIRKEKQGQRDTATREERKPYCVNNFRDSTTAAVGGRAPGEFLVPSWRHIGDTQRSSVANMSRRGAICVGDGSTMRARRQRISIQPCRIRNKHTEHAAQLQFSGAKV